MAKTKKELKKHYSYRAKPSVVAKAQKKVIKEDKTLSEKIEDLLEDYISPVQSNLDLDDMAKSLNKKGGKK